MDTSKEKQVNLNPAAQHTLSTPPLGDLPQVTNAEFVSTVFSKLPYAASPAVCSKPGNPKEGGWPAKRADSATLPDTNNNYLSCSSFYPGDDGTFNVQKDRLAAYNCAMLDDLNTKIPLERVGDFELSWQLETSPGNFQGGIILAEPITDVEEADRLLKALIAAGLCDKNSTGLGRWARLPNAINGKPEHRDANGAPFKCRLIQWRPEKRYTVQEVIDGLKLVLEPKKDPAPQRVAGDIPSSRENAGNTSLEKLVALLNRIDPDCDYEDWTRVGMAVFHETNGSDEGLALFDRWSFKGKKYKGSKDIEDKWRSFRNVTNPVTVGTLIMMAKDAGADVAGIMHRNDEDFEICEEVVNPIVEVTAGMDCPLARFSLRDHVDELEKQAVEQTLILGNIALLGQATVVYAKPNTGKTLIILFLIIEAIKKGQLDPSKLFYINMDDDSKGLVEKARFAEKYHFHMIADGHQEFEAKLFRETMVEMIETNTAKGVIIVLDTLKKFADLMDKGKSSGFARLIRQFIIKGGTVLALAHTNKHPDSDGKPVYAGTSDIVDDFDCSYTMRPISDVDGKKVVEFSNFKKRGKVALTASYSYSLECDITYTELLLSVEEVDEVELMPLKHAAEVASDAEVITAIESCIRDGINKKMQLAVEAGKRASTSKLSALNVIEKYTGDDPAIHRWSFAVRERGAKVYVLLERPSEQESTSVIDTL